MGVTGLWKLIDQSGKPVPLETLENKILAIDISIWLHQVIKGFQDAKGASLPNAHLLGLFHRLCKLLFYKIKPVFVFDGGVPDLKRDTLRKRAKAKNKLHNEAERLQQLLLESLVKEKVVQQALGSSATNLISPAKVRPNVVEKFDMFKLPPMIDPKTGEILDEPKSDISESDTSLDDNSASSSSRLYNKPINIQSIDVTNDKFKSLPADIRHEILTDIKETRKQSSWGRLHELPAQSDDFSSFQMKRLLKRRQVQFSLETAEKEMGGKTLSLAELETLFTEEGIVDASTKASKRIIADENSYAFYVNDLMTAKKKAEELAEAESSPPKIQKLDVIAEDDNADEQMDEDLQRAIQMSLDECIDKDATIVANDDGGEIRLRTEQKRLLGDAAKKLARAYMIEYGNMNADEIVNLVNMDEEDENEAEETFKYNKSLIFPTTNDEKSEIIVETNPQPITINESDSESNVSSDADSDLIDVADMDSDINSRSNIHYIEQIEMNKPIGADLSKDFRLSDLKRKFTPIEVHINPETIKAPDDLFADIFDETGDKKNQIEEMPKESKKDNLPAGLADVSENKRNVESIEEPQPSTSKEAFKISHENIAAGPETKIQKSSDKKSVLNDILQELVNDLNNVKNKGVPNILNLDDVDDKEKLTSKSMQEEMNCIKESVQEHQSAKKCDTIQESSKNEVPTAIEDELSSSKATVSYDREKEIEPAEDKTDSNKNLKLIENDTDKVKKTNSTQLTSQIQQTKPPDTIDLTNILQDLDKDLISVKETTISLLDDKVLPKLSNNAISNNDVIEILDDNDVLIKTPSKLKVQSQISNYLLSDGKIQKTPTKQQTTEKSESESNESSKTPTQYHHRHKKTSSSQLLATKKNLFHNDVAKVVQNTVDKVNECKNVEELTAMASTVRQEKQDIEFERNKQDRGAVSVTDRMSRECRELLKMFGIPYIIAPMEAEAQCAFLDAIELTDGTITDDSDIWLFGGQTVYKNFFNQQKLVLEYRVEAIDRLYKVNREKMIQLAMLVGSDYTQGIAGIGAVTAMEILATFKSTPEDKDETTTRIMSILSGLRKFRSWWEHSRNTDKKSGLRSKLRNIELNEDFPSARVLDAYLNPIVDESRERFTWGNPDAETIREFAKTKFGWTRSKTDDILLPVLKKLDEKKSQASIRNYFKCQRVIKNNETITVSKRVRSAIKRMDVNSDDEDEEDKVEQKKQTRPKRVGVKKGATKKTPSKLSMANGDGSEEIVTEVTEEKDAVTKLNRRTRQKKSSVENECSSKKIPKIPDPNPPIRQRVKDLAQFEANKQKAIELLKKKKN